MGEPRRHLPLFCGLPGGRLAAAGPGAGEVVTVAAPNCPFHGLDSLWIQVAGLSCDLRCAHCFNASGPGNREMPALSRDDVRTLLAEAEESGVRDIVFTGGEPFLHPEMAEIAGDTLGRFPPTPLNNGPLL